MYAGGVGGVGAPKAQAGLPNVELDGRSAFWRHRNFFEEMLNKAPEWHRRRHRLRRGIYRRSDSVKFQKSAFKKVEKRPMADNDKGARGINSHAIRTGDSLMKNKSRTINL